MANSITCLKFRHSGITFSDLFYLNWHQPLIPLGFPSSSVGKEPACNAGDPGLIAGWGRSPGEGIGYPLQYSGLENSMDCNSPWGCKESDTTEQLSLSHFPFTCPFISPQHLPSYLILHNFYGLLSVFFF